MAYTLPLDNQTWPDFRILVAPTFAASQQGDSAWVAGGANSGLPLAAKSGCSWTTLPYKRRGLNQPGFWVHSFDRGCLPYVGQAIIAYDYGTFDDATVASPSDLALAANMEVRIQVADRAAGGASQNWTTGWWGRVDYVEDKGDPGASVPRGRKLYHCVDGLYRAKRWTLDRHGAYTYGGKYGIAQRGDLFGHPGYNYQKGVDAALLGNRYTSSTEYTTPAGVSVWFHQQAGATKPSATADVIAASLWTDQMAAEHALGANKPSGEPTFSLQGAAAADLLSGKNPWPVHEGESVHDFLVRVLRRERGKGVAFVDWQESDPLGALTVFITVSPQLAADVNYTDPSSGSSVVVQGATSRATTTTVDLVGDHRCVAEQFQLGDPEQFRLDFLETMGEPIETLATLSILDGKVGSSNQFDGVALMRGWTDLQQAAFVGLAANSAQKKEEDRYNPVFQLVRLNAAWDGRAGDGNGGASVPLHRIDYRTNAAGQIITPLTAIANKSTDPADSVWLSPLLVEILPDTPLLEGYAYTLAKPQRWDSSTGTPANTDELNLQLRRRMTGYVRVSANRYVQFDDSLTPLSASIHLDSQGIWVRHSGDESAGTRFFSVSGVSGYTYDYFALVVTVGLRLPSRVRFASGDPRNGRRRGRIFHPGSHLWLASPGAIWALDTSTATSGAYAARRAAGLGAVINGTDSTPGILRDDRSGLAMIHNLAWAWYGSDTTHRSAQWGLRACGFLPSYLAYAGTTIPAGSSPQAVPYPRLGQVVTQITANGQGVALNTPVTRIAYNNEAGLTTWSTEWSELERVQR